VIVVVGIGADGIGGLSPGPRAELARASVIYGSRRQLGLLDDTVTAQRRQWPSPMLPALDALPDGVHVLASGDPMLYGLGGTLTRLLGPQRVRVLPHISSVALACARLGWNLHDTAVISLLTAAPHTAVRRGGRAVVLSRDAASPAAVASLLTDAGRGDSRFTVFEQLGGPAERRRPAVSAIAAEWAADPPGDVDDLNLIAVEYLPDERTSHPSDDAFCHDGQITKRTIRALTLAALAPRPGELLWDVGAGSGSIAVEWSISQPGCAAVAFERDERRRDRITRNAVAFGVNVQVRGPAPDDFTGSPPAAALFVGGGLTQAGMIDACVDHLPAGGRLVANAVTAESEALLTHWHGRLGGDLRRFSHYHGEPLGAFTGWRPAMPVTQWAVTKR